MAKKTVILTPKIQKILLAVGEQIKLARLRRKLSAELVSERAGISRATLWAIENGSSTVSFGSYVSVLCALGLESDILLLAKDDVLGRTLQDMNLLPKKRAPKTNNGKEVLNEE
ncbi:MAG: helix-turn-helix transcriptional regulator [Treponema sp.]|nr:helix-turn-helix transcriptional regulator [Treponema sp.]